MSIKHSLASKARWAKMTDEQKAARMSKISITRWSKINKDTRKKIALSLVAARKQKHVTK